MMGKAQKDTHFLLQKIVALYCGITKQKNLAEGS